MHSPRTLEEELHPI
jgi:hypothetical protein